ncbi:hypothetical protein TNCT_604881 [Trichonephila clavata]|uniref:Uncharacterized protein n=1 Tax=Trichonephila clavata TaxID=2740835 RepID=A0A8X6F9X0_TRICU|nr:hypothetical protein TNCT_604881 [Trichonephila clavata]
MGSLNSNTMQPNISTNDATIKNQNKTLSEQKLLNEIIFLPNSTSINKETGVTKDDVKQKTSKPHILLKIHRTITRSKDAVWATITLTFICVLLLVAVAQSRMWKDYRGPESQGVPLPNFNERVLFKDVMEHKLKSLKEIFQKKKKQKNNSEMESLLPPGEWDDESSDIPIP